MDSPANLSGVPFLGLLRWYGLMYVLAFSTAYLVMSKLRKAGMLDTQEYKASDDDLFSFFFTGVIFLLIGARIFSTLIYDTSGYYLQKPWRIFWPFDEDWNFTGLAGMSYHGGVVGGTIGMIVWCLKRKKPFWQWMDAMAIAIPLGFTFGRIGNFLNGELFGRITTMPWGMVFPSAQKFSLSLPWVAEFAQRAGLDTSAGGLINLPRHPSQLYEALFEGIFLFFLTWLISKKKPYPGFLSGIYYAGYGVIRFIIEYFRQPDADLGFRIASNSDASIYLNSSLLNISTGKFSCAFMILGGSGLIIVQGLRSRKTAQSS